MHLSPSCSRSYVIDVGDALLVYMLAQGRGAQGQKLLGFSPAQKKLNTSGSKRNEIAWKRAVSIAIFGILVQE